MNYLDGYKAISPEALQKDDRPPDVDFDLLPFELLGWRRFELLVYLLKRDLAPDPTLRFDIMSGSADQGCDILTCAADGNIQSIAQCKNHREPLTATDIAAELIKVELYLSPHQIERANVKGLRFEIWAPRFANDAIRLVAEWPRRWNSQLAKSAFSRVKKKYVAFRKLRWNDVASQLEAGVPRRFELLRFDGHKITEFVRSRPALSRQFFQVSTMVGLDDARQLLHENEATTTARVIRLLHEQKFRPIVADDLRHIHDIITSIPEDRRFFLGHGYCCGIDRGTHQRMDADERTEFFMHTLNAVHGPAQIALSVATKASFDAMCRLRLATPQPSGAFVYVAHKFISDTLQIRFRRLVIPKFMHSELHIPQKDPCATVDEFASLAVVLWNELQSGIPLIPLTDPDRPRRLAIIYKILGTTRSAEDFVKAVRSDFAVHHQLLNSLHGELLQMIPERLIVVSDSLDVDMSDKETMQRWVNSSQEMSAPDGRDANKPV